MARGWTLVLLQAPLAQHLLQEQSGTKIYLIPFRTSVSTAEHVICPSVRLSFISLGANCDSSLSLGAETLRIFCNCSTPGPSTCQKLLKLQSYAMFYTVTCRGIQDPSYMSKDIWNTKCKSCVHTSQVFWETWKNWDIVVNLLTSKDKDTWYD